MVSQRKGNKKGLFNVKLNPGHTPIELKILFYSYSRNVAMKINELEICFQQM